MNLLPPTRTGFTVVLKVASRRLKISMPRNALWCQTAVRIAFVGILASRISVGTDLSRLAGLDGAPGDEARVVEFIAERAGGAQQTGANGSLIVSFGRGSPRTLLVAGVDEPGFVVSAIHPRGYLWLQPLAVTQFGTGLHHYFRGQHVRVSTGTGRVLSGVVPAPSVHFASIAGARSGSGSEGLLLDIGASSSQEVKSAGVGVLDRVTLEKRVAMLSEDWLSAPWVSSRAGAALLLSLARRLRHQRVEGTVMLAFVTQQYPHNAGTARVLGSEDADRVLLIAPHGGTEPALAPATGSDPGPIADYLAIARNAGLRLQRKSSHSLDFGPFASAPPWKPEQEVTVLLPAVRNRATPAESIRVGDLELLAEALGMIVGLEPGNDPSLAESSAASSDRNEAAEAVRSESGFFERTVRALVAIPGVSGHEDRVRQRIRQLIPREKRFHTRVDPKGNLIVRLGNARETSAAFLAHMDEIGFEVRSVLPGGSVSVSSKGGGSPGLFAWQPASVHGAYGSVPAVMTSNARLEFGAAGGDYLRQLGVRTGDSTTVPKRYRTLLGNRVSARSLDDRLGCAVLLDVMRRLTGRTREAGGSVEFVFTVEEETGLRGARHYAEQVRPRVVYPIDTFVTADSPFGPNHLARASLGAGAVLRAIDESGMTPRREVERVVALAKRHRIPLQYGVTAGGNDGSVFAFLETANVPIGFPLRYAHTPVETADLRDARSVTDLVEVLALEELRRR